MFFDCVTVSLCACVVEFPLVRRRDGFRPSIAWCTWNTLMFSQWVLFTMHVFFFEKSRVHDSGLNHSGIYPMRVQVLHHV